jgi:Bifunctional DNA primase/polymerase, N-terminal
VKASSVYGRIGWRVVPLHSAIAGVCSCSKGGACPNAGKHPRIADWVEQASADPEVIAAWAARWPDGNTGIATGAASGFFVLDVDPGNDGPATLEALELEHGELPHTVRAVTGSGGSHFLFTLPAFTVANSAGKLGPGLDTRGDGGQIVVAPSVSAKGPYAWINAPWNTPIAEAPAWLLELLKARPAPRAVAHRDPDEPSAVFPRASSAVIEAARDALELHGPAIEGDGGDQHTFVAAALLCNDFALTDDEAAPLFAEWNASCQPPWSEDDLAAKLRGGSKYATQPYGCRRSLDTVEAAKALITAWQNSGTGEATMFDMIAQVRKLALVCGDPAKHGVIQRKLAGATGLGARALMLPAPLVIVDAVKPAGSIQVTPALHEVADEATKAIAPSVFTRNGVLCQIVRGDQPGRTFLSDLEPAGLVDLMSRSAKWVRTDKEGIVVIPPPVPIAQILHARRTHASVRVIEAVTTAPVFLADGSILQARGYNAQARVFLEPSVSVDVPDAPTRDDARAAVMVFRRLLSDFKFAGKGDFSSWLAGVLSSLVKTATANAPGPLICVSASSPGAGKSLLTGIASRIIAGAPPEIRPYNPKDAGEWGKRVTAFVRAGTPISVFDNVNGAFGDETVDRLVTSSTWSDRVLGASDAPPIAIVTTWWATGNQIEPQGDTVRRVLMCRIEVDDERPQERTGFALKNILAHTLEHRSELLSAALTILRAYHVAGRPAQDLPAWGSFEAWSDLVRGAIVWTGAPDPFLTQRRAADELQQDDHEAHDFWLSVIESTDGTPNVIAAQANAAKAAEVLGVRDAITGFAVKKFVRRFVDKPRRSKRIRRDGARYYVEAINRAG